MENVLDFLRRATRHRIRVFPTFGDGGVPLNAYYRERLPGGGRNRNLFILTEEGIAARVEYITSFLTYIKNEDLHQQASISCCMVLTLSSSLPLG